MKIKKVQQSAGVTANVVNSLDSNSTIDALSAAAGKELNEKVKQYGTYSEEEQEIGTFMGKTLYRRVFHGGGDSNYIYLNEGDKYLDLYTFSETKGYTFHFFPVKIDVTYFMYDSDIVDQCGWYSGAADNDYEGVVTPIVTFDRDGYGSAVALRWDFANTANKMIGDVIITVEYTREDWGSFGDWNMPG